jgi:hypothetical protein
MRRCRRYVRRLPNGAGRTCIVVATPKLLPSTSCATPVTLAVGPKAASSADWVAFNAVAEVTRILKARSRDELFVSLQLLGKYWQARAKNEASGNITIDEWPSAAGYKWYHALRRRCEDTSRTLRDEPESDALPSAMVSVLAPDVKPEGDRRRALRLGHRLLVDRPAEPHRCRVHLLR